MIRLALALALLTAHPARAADVTNDSVGNIFATCDTMKRLMTTGTSETQGFFDGGVCQGFMAGALAFMEPSPAYCFPEKGVRYSDLVLIFVAFIDKEPVWRTRSPRAALEASFIDAFPCPGAPKKK